MLRMLHIAKGEPSERIWIPRFVEELRRLGELTILSHGEAMSEEEIAARMRACDVLLIGWDAVRIPLAIAQDPGALSYICSVTGTLCDIVPLEVIDAGLPVTNWGDAPAGGVAEAAVTLTLALVKGLPERIQTVRAGGWAPGPEFFSGMVEDLNIGVYGCGFIGRRYVEMLQPFRPVIRIFDPYAAGLPAGAIRVDSLEALFGASEVVAIHAGLTPQTRGTVTAELLAMLPDGGVIINTARGGIIDQAALFAELERGRLRSGLDVLQPDSLPADHPARQWPNLVLTAHDLAKERPREGFPPQRLLPMHRICLENLRRFQAGEPLRFVMDRERYLLST